jgi:galactokinase
MQQADLLIDKFRDLFGNAPDCVAFAPGRVNLIGEHTDYNGGHVFPCALPQGTLCAARARNDRVLRFFSLNVPRFGVAETRLDALVPGCGRGWQRYAEGVVQEFRIAGYEVERGADFMFWSDVPAGAGLSSSAALEVSAGLALKELFGLDIPAVRLALLCQRAENEYVGMNCGIMDQFTSAMGREGCALFLDTATLEYSYAPFDRQDAGLVIVNSRVKHALAGSSYNERREQCETALRDMQAALPVEALCGLTPELFEEYKTAVRDPVCRRRAKHAVYENARTVAALNALNAGELAAFGRLMNESHVSLRDDFEVSCPELDLLAELSWDTPGVLGARMTGGGFGGCLVALVETDAREAYIRHTGEEYRKRTGLEAGFYPAVPAGGARLV